MFTFPAAVSSSAFAAKKDAVEMADFQHAFLWMIRYFFHAQRKGMEVEQQLAVTRQASTGNMCIAQHHPATAMLISVATNERKDLRIVVKVGIIEVHDLHLPPVNSFEPQIDVRRCQEIEPKLGFRLAYIGNT